MDYCSEVFDTARTVGASAPTDLPRSEGLSQDSNKTREILVPFQARTEQLQMTILMTMMIQIHSIRTAMRQQMDTASAQWKILFDNVAIDRISG